MPTYDYECDNGHRFEAFQSMKDQALTTCSQCGGKARRRIGAGAGFIFKGSGFYSTDNRSKEYKDKAKSESSASPGESGGAGSGATTGDKGSTSDKGAAGDKGSAPPPGGGKANESGGAG